MTFISKLRMACYGSIFFFNDTATTEIYTLSLHDALPIFAIGAMSAERSTVATEGILGIFYPFGSELKRLLGRSEEHTSELQSPCNIVCRLLLEKKIRRVDTRITRRTELAFGITDRPAKRR